MLIDPPKFKSALIVAVVVGIGIGVSGCFRSATPLIQPADADFPFRTITYENDENDDVVTLVRNGQRYINPQEDGDEFILLKAIAADTYVVQAAIARDQSTEYYFGLARVAADKSAFTMTMNIAGDADLDAVREGRQGLRLCPDDSDIVCIESLEAFTAYAMDAANDGSGRERATLKIRALE